MNWRDRCLLIFIAFVVACGAFVTMAALISVAHAEPSYVANGRFVVRRENGPVHVPTGGVWFPEGWNITPGPGQATVSLYTTPATVGDGYGKVLYVQFTGYDPFPEPGRAWLQGHIVEYDQLIGQTVQLTWWQKVDACCVGVLPMLMINYHNGDYQFWGADGYFIADQTDVNWPQQTAKRPAEYFSIIKNAPYCLATAQWTECSMVFPLPDGAGHTLSRYQRHITIAMNFRGRTAAGIHIAHLRLEVQS